MNIAIEEHTESPAVVIICSESPDRVQNASPMTGNIGNISPEGSPLNNANLMTIFRALQNAPKIISNNADTMIRHIVSADDSTTTTTPPKPSDIRCDCGEPKSCCKTPVCTATIHQAIQLEEDSFSVFTVLDKDEIDSWHKSSEFALPHESLDLLEKTNAIQNQLPPIPNRAFHFGEDINSAEKSMGQHIIQCMLTDILEKNQELTLRVKELTELNSQMQTAELNPSLVVNQYIPSPAKKTGSLTNDDETIDATKFGPHLEGLVDRISRSCTIRSCSRSSIVSKSELRALRAQNESLIQKLAKAKQKRKKQSDKIYYWKEMAVNAGVVQDIDSDSESEATFSMVSTIFAADSNSCYDGDMPNATASSLSHQNIWPSMSTDEDGDARSTKTSSASANFVITGFAMYRLKQYIADLQARVEPSNSWRRDNRPTLIQTGENMIPKDDRLDDIYTDAAEFYAEHIKEQAWRNSGLVLEWEAPPSNFV